MATAPFSAQAAEVRTTDYIGNKVYENNALKRILIDGGYNRRYDLLFLPDRSLG
jgi:hypothetical protein